MINISEKLQNCSLFSDISRENIAHLLGCLGAKIRTFDNGQTIFSEGESADEIGIVISGGVRIIKIDYFGNRSILYEAHMNETFCEGFACSTLDELPASVIAEEETTVLLINASRVLKTCDAGCGFHHKLIYNLMKELANKTVLYHERIDVTARRTTKEKLMAYLHTEAKRKKSLSFDIPFDRQELADYLEVERSGLSSEIGKLVKKGVIKTKKNHFEILSANIS